MHSPPNLTYLIQVTHPDQGRGGKREREREREGVVAWLMYVGCFGL